MKSWKREVAVSVISAGAVTAASWTMRAVFGEIGGGLQVL